MKPVLPRFQPAVKRRPPKLKALYCNLLSLLTN